MPMGISMHLSHLNLFKEHEMPDRITELEGRVERLRQLIPQTNGEYRQMLESNLGIYERELNRVRVERSVAYRAEVTP